MPGSSFSLQTSPRKDPQSNFKKKEGDRREGRKEEERRKKGRKKFKKLVVEEQKKKKKKKKNKTEWVNHDSVRKGMGEGCKTEGSGCEK